MNIILMIFSWIFYPPLFYYKCREKGLSSFWRILLTLMSPFNILLILNIWMAWNVIMPIFAMLFKFSGPAV